MKDIFQNVKITIKIKSRLFTDVFFLNNINNNK